MKIDIKRLRANRKVAKGEKDHFRPLLDDLYRYVMPYRKSVAETGKGQRRTNEAHDHTAIVSTYRSANRLANDISPAGQQSFDLKIGPIAKTVLDEAQQQELSTVLQAISTICGAQFQTGEWDAALAEMCVDLMGGTGAMLMDIDRENKRMRFVAASIEEVNLTCDGYGKVNGIYWDRKWMLQAIADEFGDSNWPQELKDKLKANPESETVLHQDTVWNVKLKRWERVAWIDAKPGDGKTEAEGLELRRGESRKCPWITPRYFVVPGETYGRGPALLAMPTVKALNTAVKLNLQAAAIALLGIYTAIDDGVFNPDNAPIAPGVFWKVARNGGTLGPSISKLPEPRLDLAMIVIKEFRMAIQEAMNDQQLPPDGAAVRSATEIIERVKRLASDHMGAFGRIIMEVMVPAVEYTIEGTAELGLHGEEIEIDKLLTDIQVSSPMAMAREAERWQKVMQVVDTAIMFAQSQAVPGVAEKIKLDNVFTDFARDMGVPEKYLPTPEEKAELQDEAAMAEAAAVAAQSPEMLGPDMLAGVAA